jgi:aminoglycoside phosphotransferase (APT) family kinase protein
VIIDSEAIDRVLELLRKEPGFESAVLAGPPEPISRGFWATMRLLRLRHVDSPADSLVLRVMPDASLAVKEAAFQSQIGLQGFPVPKVHLVGGPDVGLGGAFIVMDRAPGHPPLDGLDPMAAIRRLPYLSRGLPDLLGRVSARLHRLDPRPLRAAILEDSTSAPANLAGFLIQLTESISTFDRPDLAAAGERLARSQPSPSREAICHGDLHPFNLLVDNDRWTLLDWTTGLITEPAYDLAFTSLMLRHPPMAAPYPLDRLIEFAGAAVARRFLSAYRQSGGQPPSRSALDWFTALHALRALVEVEWWRSDGTLKDRAGHPWLIIGSAAAQALSRTTGVAVAWSPE